SLRKKSADLGIRRIERARRFEDLRNTIFPPRRDERAREEKRNRALFFVRGDGEATLEPPCRSCVLVLLDVELGQRIEGAGTCLDLHDSPIGLDGTLSIFELEARDLGEATVERSSVRAAQRRGLLTQKIGQLLKSPVPAKHIVERFDRGHVARGIHEICPERFDASALPLDAIDETCKVEPKLNPPIAILGKGDLALPQIEELGEAPLFLKK